jgi:protoporphyrinogen/coproporphyrinogen III oxidase
VPATRSRKAAVVGGGITGLTTAWSLHRAGFGVTVFEQSGRAGGNIRTIERDGWLIEAGPNTLQCQPAVSQLLEELGLAGQRALANESARKRFIVRGGRLVPVPLSPASLLTSPLFSMRSRLRVLMELTYRPRIRTADTTLSSFIAAHFGQEIVDYGMDPFVSGIYAGNPDKLSARYSFPALWQLERTHGSLLRGLRAQAAERRAAGKGGQPPIISFPRGLQTLPDTIAAKLPPGSIRTGETVTTVIPGKPWKLISNRGGLAETHEFDAVVLALPADGLAALAFGTLGERPLASLENLPHPPVSTLFLGFPREAVPHPLDGFGALVPSKEKRQILGVLFSSTLFPGRAPGSHVALTVFAGGSRQPEIARLDPQKLLEIVMRDLRVLLGISGAPVFTHHTFWPRAIPQYKVGHERFLEPISQCENAHDGLYLATNARDGISLPDCIKNGYAVAEKVAQRLSR